MCIPARPPTPTMLTVDSPTWQGWLRPDGRKGIRNLILVI
jgi:hypothetical protein